MLITDPYYAYMAGEYPDSEIKNAGYLQERKEWLKNENFLPFEQLPDKSLLSTTKRNIVLLSTGSFAPIHLGHIEMLKIARRYYEDRGCNVIGGYLSPSHDKYVSEKLGRHDYNALERLSFIHNLIDETREEWIMPLLWESVVPDEPVNFTTVIQFLSGLLSRQHYENVHIVYVFGSDNIEFSKAFKEKGEAICICRSSKTISQTNLNRNCILISGSCHYHVSSTAIRDAGQQKKENKGGVLLIRNDIHRALNRGQDFSRPICTDLKKFFEQYSIPDLRISIVTEEMERAVIEDIDFNEVLSLDVWHGKHRYRVSREFDWCGGGTRPEKGLVSRGNIPELRKILFDDDSISGSTLKLLEKKHGKFWNTEIFLMDLIRKRFFPDENIVDVVDARDFVFGARYGGLMTRFENIPLRIPYIWPFVNLENRASILPSNMIDFSIDIIRMNKELLDFEKYRSSEKILPGEMLNRKEKVNIYDLIDKVERFLKNGREGIG